MQRWVWFGTQPPKELFEKAIIHGDLNMSDFEIGSQVDEEDDVQHYQPSLFPDGQALPAEQQLQLLVPHQHTQTQDLPGTADQLQAGPDPLPQEADQAAHQKDPATMEEGGLATEEATSSSQDAGVEVQEELPSKTAPRAGRPSKMERPLAPPVGDPIRTASGTIPEFQVRQDA